MRIIFMAKLLKHWVLIPTNNFARKDEFNEINYFVKIKAEPLLSHKLKTSDMDVASLDFRKRANLYLKGFWKTFYNTLGPWSKVPIEQLEFIENKKIYPWPLEFPANQHTSQI